MDDRLDLSFVPLEEFYDPLGRKPGETIGGHINKDDLLVLYKAKPRLFAALYMQNPRVMGGRLINSDWFTVIAPTQIPDTTHMKIIRFYDFAYGEKQVAKAAPDFTATAKIGLWKSENSFCFILFHVDRWQTSWTETKRRVVILANEEGRKTWIGTERNGAQKAAFEDLQSTPELRGFKIIGDNPVSDKVARAQFWIDKAESGDFLVVDQPTLPTFYDECDVFNAGRYDDQIDAVSGACNILKPFFVKKGFSLLRVEGLYGR